MKTLKLFIKTSFFNKINDLMRLTSSYIYKNIYVPNSPCSDDQFACRVESWLQQSTYLANDANASFITIDLLYDCIESLKLRKAAGHDGVTSEHIWG